MLSNKPLFSDIKKSEAIDTNNFLWEGATYRAQLYLWYVRKFPNHPSKLRLVRYIGSWIFSKGLPIYSPHGAKLLLNVSDPDYIPHYLIHRGAWEPKSLALAIKLMSQGGTFLDIGGHFGLYTCAVGVLDGVDCICVEPSPKIFIDLVNNIRLNSQIKAQLVHIALSSLPSLRTFGITSNMNSGRARIFTDEEEGVDDFLLSCITLQELLDHLNTRKIELIKIDVEGFEIEALKTLRWSDSCRPKNIIAELEESLLNRTGYSLAEFLEFFDARGYEALTVEGHPFDIDSLSQLPENNIWFKSRF